MSTFAAVKARIASEIKRTTLTTDIAAHMLRAIEFYAPKRTWKNEGTSTITLTADTATKAIPTGLRTLDRLAVVVSGYDYELDKVTRERMADRQGGVTTTGQPTEFSWEGANFNFWPTPDEAYVVNVAGIFDDTALSADSDTNSWTTIGENLIVARTKFTICRDLTLDAEMMTFAQAAEREARRRLFTETNERTATGTIAPGW